MDTRNKRASVLGFALAALVVLPAPDGTIAQADRQHVAFSYAGLSAALPTVQPVRLHVRGLVLKTSEAEQVRCDSSRVSGVKALCSEAVRLLVEA